MDSSKLNKYFFTPKSADEIKDSAYIVIDTNVLLSAYQWKEVTLYEVLDTLNTLSANNRLKIPSHVLSEFMDQRPKRIVEIIQKIDKEINSKLQRPPKLSSIVPLLETLGDSQTYFLLEEQYIESYKNYKQKLSQLTTSLGKFLNSDPVLEEMENLIKNSYFELDSEKLEQAKNEAKVRIQEKRPPLTGGDSSKKENSLGDFIIWKHILSIEGDVIFVSSDTKDDWVVKDHHGNILGPRRELIEEFYDCNPERSLLILPPKKFVELFKPNISGVIAEDLSNKKSIMNESLLSQLREIFNRHDPAYVHCFSKEENEYDQEINVIISILPSAKSSKLLAFDIYKIMTEYFGDENLVGPLDKYFEIADEIWKFKKSTII